MALRQWMETVTRLTISVRWRSRVARLMVMGVLIGSTAPTAETPSMHTEAPVVAAQEPIAPLQLHLALDAQRVALGARLFHNARAEAIFGYTAAEASGMPLTRLMPDRYQASRMQRFTEWSTTGVSRLVGTTVEFVGRRKDGSEFPLEVSLSTWSTAHEHYVTGIWSKSW